MFGVNTVQTVEWCYEECGLIAELSLSCKTVLLKSLLQRNDRFRSLSRVIVPMLNGPMLTKRFTR